MPNAFTGLEGGASTERVPTVAVYLQGRVHACVIHPVCVRKAALAEVLGAFLSVLDGDTLTHLVAPRRWLATLLELIGAA